VTVTAAGRLRAADVRVEDLAALVDTVTDPARVPHAAAVDRGVPVYEAATLRAADPEAVRAELASALADGPGVVAVAGAVERTAVDRVTRAFDALVAEQRRTGAGAGDHFAAPGANDRVWNALEKLAVRDPDAFVDYYGSEVLALVAHAWLGPGYQVTSQVNVVHPGGAAQVPHRDYHLGFLPLTTAERYPAHVHALSPALTVQAVIAHGDMPVESGPTMLLPHSQRYPHGYLIGDRPEFRELFAARHVQLPLRSGDAVFLNPALLHAAGHNRSVDVRRTANLLQVSSAFGRAMEAVDRARVCVAIHPALRARRGAPGLANAVAAAAEGYSFPTNLDRDPPVGGLAPPTQADLVHAALAEDWDTDRLCAALAGHADRRRTA
jgi:ectoine hydroxylase-related dioxygenase (phytanoyl-CoA dioxygenase family)